MTARSLLALAALLLAVLAYGIAGGVGTGAPPGYEAADCFHVDADGAVRDCADAAGPAAPTAAVQAADWTWWGAAAPPLALAAAAFLLWRHLRRRLPRRRKA
ncbi:hypothetical protein LO763_02235 [Glycomyces sp. A-F 0318]|uniref:hypothetical protein n=1 Tax=Glycomyces amatae TaxID=2881355 RepID=UPI001E51F974|nr:hypothetical protein [Glycomyces amatae]MCD0442443.1 hypothetical protein [Glycomyces amatae]